LVSAAHCNYLCKNNASETVEICCCLEETSQYSCLSSDFCGSSPTLQLAKPQDLQIVCNYPSQEIRPAYLNKANPVILPIIEIRNHPSYKPLSAVEGGPIDGYDICVYVVDDSRLTMSQSSIWPACLPKASETAYLPGNRGILSGWISPLPTYLYFPDTPLGTYAGQNLWERESLFEKVPCGDPAWMKSNTFYPAGTVCYTEPAWAASVQFGVSGSGIMRPFLTLDNKTHYSWAGPLSLSKGTDLIIFPTLKYGQTQFSSNPAVFTDARCYMDWIAAQYDLTMPSSYSRPVSCDQASGSKEDVNVTSCLSRNTYLFAKKYGVWPCEFTRREPACSLYPIDRKVRPTSNLNFYFCKNIMGEIAACANNCPGIDANAVVVGGVSALFAVATAAPDILGPLLGVGSIMAGVGLGNMAMGNTRAARCPRGQCWARIVQRCCQPVLENGQQICPRFC
jgi:hypothetical protein